MKSKGVFIIIGIYMAAAAILYYSGISTELIILLSGFVMIIIGIMLLIQEIGWRKNSDIVNGKVTRYHQYTNSSPGGNNLMYTMEAEYITAGGKLIIAKEQSGCNRKKYSEGTPLKIRYSREDPYLFIIDGDYSRIFAMISVIAMGAAIVAIFGYIIRQGGN